MSILILVLVSISGLKLYAQPNWESMAVDSNTFKYVLILIDYDSVKTDFQLEDGDWIGVFNTKMGDNKLICRGKTEFNTNYPQFPIYGFDSAFYGKNTYRIWKKKYNCILDSTIVLMKTDTQDSIIIYDIQAKPIEVFYPNTSLCANAWDSLKPYVERHKENIIFSALDSRIIPYIDKNGTITNPHVNLSVFDVRAHSQEDYCLSKNDFQITIDFPPIISIQKEQFICQDTSLILSPTPDSTVNKWYWSDGSSGPDKIVTTQGSYVISAFTKNGCSNSDTVIVKKAEDPIFSITNELKLCAGEKMTIKPDYIDTSYTWVWNDNLKSPTMPVEQEGTFILKALNKEGCVHKESVKVVYKPSPDFKVENTRYICPGHQIVLSPENEQENYQWNWNNNLNTRDIQVDQTGTYILKAINSEGCEKIDTIKVLQKKITFDEIIPEVEDATCLKPGKIRFQSLLLNNATEPYRIVAYNKIDNSQSDIENVKEGNYTIQVEDAEGCVAISEIEINIPKNCLNEFPVFTPGVYGKEASYYVSQEGNAKVYDRNGRIICTFVAPAYWDGNDNTGRPVPMGTYLLVVGNNNPVNITIIR